MNVSPDDTASGKAAGPVATTCKFAISPFGNLLRNLPLWSRSLLRAPCAQTPPLPTSAIAAISLLPAVVVVSMFFVDAAATEWAQHLPRWFTNSFRQITSAGLGDWWLIPTAAGVLAFASVTSIGLTLMTRGVLAALASRCGFLFLAIGVPGLFVTIIKGVVGRARPLVGGHVDPFAYAFFAWRAAYASMPSGHATNVAAAAIAVGAIWPRMRALMWLYALVIMFSRVVVFAHYASDVIAGAVVGAVGASLVRRFFAARRLVFSPQDLSAYPGPSLRRTRRALRQAISRCGNSEMREAGAD